MYLKTKHLAGKQVHCMIDIETLGLNPGCDVLEIGTVIFTEDGTFPEISSHFKIDCVDYYPGLDVDHDTVQWHKEQNVAFNFGAGNVSRASAAGVFRFLVEDYNEKFSPKYWANSPYFDFAILDKWLSVIQPGYKLIIPFRDQLDFRTVRNTIEKMYGGRFKYNLKHSHTAYEDAEDQANYLIALNKFCAIERGFGFL